MILDLNYGATHCEWLFNYPNEKILIVTKGRRYGATRCALQACAEWTLEGKTILWGDTVAGNIDRYVDRYLIPIFKVNNIPYHYHRQNKQFEAGSGYIDFRSADRSENWEGFGYDKIILNEAGIILKGERGRYLYENAVRPMLMDSEKSQLIAVGVPKGIMYKGTQTLFYELSKQYKHLEYSTYDTPFIPVSAIDEFVTTMPSSIVQQEIYGKFIDLAGSIVQREWLSYFENAPSDMTIGIGVDTASEVKTSSDYTAISVVGYKDGFYYVLDVFRDKLITPMQIANLIKRYADRYDTKTVTIEKTGQGGHLVRQIQIELGAGYWIRTTTPRKDKYERFLPIAGLYEKGMIKHSQRLIKEFQDELLSFNGNGAGHDDMVDSLEIAINSIVTKKAEFKVY